MKRRNASDIGLLQIATPSYVFASDVELSVGELVRQIACFSTKMACHNTGVTKVHCNKVIVS
jgi:hypothetical protein